MNKKDFARDSFENRSCVRHNMAYGEMHLLGDRAVMTGMLQKSIA